MSANAGAKYLENKVLTASREQLILMLYDGFLRFANEGKAGLADHDWEVACRSLIRCQDIVLELAYCLNKEQGGDVAVNLARLYHYVYRQLVDANIRHESGPIDEAVKIIGELREAWAEAMKHVVSTPPPAVSPKATSQSVAAPEVAAPAKAAAPAATPAPVAEKPVVARLTRPTAAYSAQGRPMAAPASPLAKKAALAVPAVAAAAGAVESAAPAAPAASAVSAKPGSKVLAKIPLAKMAVRADDPNRPKFSIEG